MLRIKVKASEVFNLTDARYFAAWMVDWMGFNFRSGEATAITAEQFTSFKGWIEGPKMVGEFSGLEEVETILTLKDSLELDAVQLSPVANMEMIKALGDVVLFIETNAQDPLLNDKVKALKEDDWLIYKGSVSELTEEIRATSRVLIDGPDSVDDVLAGAKGESSLGWVVRGAEEQKVGFKSFDELDDAFDLLLE